MSSGSLNDRWCWDVGMLQWMDVRSWSGHSIAMGRGGRRLDFWGNNWHTEFMWMELSLTILTTIDWRTDEQSSPRMALWPSTALRTRMVGGIGVIANIDLLGQNWSLLVSNYSDWWYAIHARFDMHMLQGFSGERCGWYVFKLINDRIWTSKC